MRHYLPFAGAALAAGMLAIVAVAGCTTAQIQQACAYDAAGQPVAVAAVGVVAPASPSAQTAAVLDTTVFHPAVLSACAKLAPAVTNSD